MTAVDIFKASRMKQIEDTTVVTGLVDPGGNLLLKTRAGQEINAGYVRGPQGDQGDQGEDGIEGSVAVPAGTISLWASDVAPANWMLCHGQAVSRTEYASLFNAIGIKYGAGDGVNTFNLPDLRGRTPVGFDSAQSEFNALAKIGGAKTHTLTEAQMPAHSHSLLYKAAPATQYVDNPATAMPTTADAENRGLGSTTGTNYLKTGVVQNTGGGQAHNILQPYSVVNFIIKVTSGETPEESELAGRVGELESNFSVMPAGTVTGWGGATAPTNWLICDGAAVSRTVYASLFAAIGISYGAGDGTTTFNLPNLRGRVPVGRDSTQTEFDTLGETGGAKTHRLTAAESGLPAHSHIEGFAGVNTGGAYGVSTAPSGNVNSQSGQSTANHANTSTTGPVDAAQAHNNLQPYQVIHYIIKFTNGDTKGDSQLTQRVSAIESGTAYSVRFRDKMEAMKRVLTGGGMRKVTATSVAWSERFIILGSAVDEFTPGGYINVSMPPNGTVIPVYDRPSDQPNFASVTVANGVIPMFEWCALYYEHTPGEGFSGSTKFRIVEYRVNQATIIPPNWFLIVARNADYFSPNYTWGDGRTQDNWEDMILMNGWVRFDPGWSPPQWRWMEDGRIALRGMIKSGTGTFVDFDDSMGPDFTELFHNVPASGGWARVDVQTNGAVGVNSYLGGGTNAWMDLKGVTWFPKGV